MKSVVILTGGELRHDFFRMAFGLSDGVEVAGAWREGAEKSLARRFEKSAPESRFRREHVRRRELSEEDFFQAFVERAPDRSRPTTIPKGDVNSAEVVSAARALQPELLVCFGSSLIRGPLLKAFAGRFMNVHLGLSPWYRGSGTNFWAMANGELECVGATFMHMDEGVDTGAIIHQVRARVHPGDSPHQIGNRLIVDAARVAADLAAAFDRIRALPQPRCEDREARVCRVKDFTEASVQALYEAFDAGLVERYLADQEARTARVPLVRQPWLAQA